MAVAAVTGLSLRELSLVEPLSVGFHAASRGRVTKDDTVVVLGCGAIGLGAVWNPWASVEIYGAYRFHELDRDNLNALNTGDPEDISAVMIGTRVKF